MTLPRLSPATLSAARAGTMLPGYARDRLGVGIVHLGLGAFARAHVATYTEDLLELEGGDWGIAGVSLRHPDQRDRLAPQDGLYTALRIDGSGNQARIIGCLVGQLFAPENPEAVVALMAATSTRIVSLTVTEKGYCHDPATGKLDLAHPDIVHDLCNLEMPRSAIGFLVAALARRRDAGQAPFTVLCCDNLPHNGRMLAGLVRDFAALRDPALPGWIAANGAFPCTMVDRIVPAATAADLDVVAAATGLTDAAPVVHEPFRQFVIEDRFVANARPRWERVGAELVRDVVPYEHMKLRLLNGAHSALAYLGYLSGHETIADVMADPVLAAYVAALWSEEIVPMVPPPPGTDLHSYVAGLSARFANTAIRHRTWQIAMDGSQKLPQRLLGTARERLGQSLPIPRLALAVAAWVIYVGGIDEAGRPIDVRDPLAMHLRELLAQAGDYPERRIGAILSVKTVFGTDLPRSAAFVGALTHAYSRLRDVGARGSAAETGGQPLTPEGRHRSIPG